MRTSTTSLLLLATALLLAGSATAQNTDPNPSGPLTTNNGKPACVQYGDCTTVKGSDIATATFGSAITSPASAPVVAQPTNSLQSANALSVFASQGAAAAFSSRVANGQPTGAGAADGTTTTPIGTGASVFALTTAGVSGSASAGAAGSASGSARPNAAVGTTKFNGAGIAASALLAVAFVAGGAIVL